MNLNTDANGFSHTVKWLLGGAVLLLLSADALALFAKQGLEQDNVAIRLLVLYVASWSYALGIVGVVSSLVWWLVEWRGGQAAQTALKPYFHAEPRRRYFEEPEGPQFLPPDVALVPSRLSRRRK